MSSPSTSNVAQPSATPFTGMVEIGGGRKVYAECAGSGSPTVVLESGDESDHYQWRLVAPRLAERTRTCSTTAWATARATSPPVAAG